MNIQQEIDNRKKRHQELETELQSPAILSNQKKLTELNQEYSEIKSILEISDRLEKAQSDLGQAEQTATETEDDELKELAESEIEELKLEIENLDNKIKIALVPPDPLDKRDIIVEIRGGTGGDEAALFAADLFRMYSRYAEGQNWKTTMISSSSNEVGGLKEVIFSIKGQNVYSQLKYESGVHRVQRIPETEKSGRIHTSTATVAILPAVEEVDMTIDPKDLKIETTTATGHGGQSVNTTYSAIRITHIPTGATVYCQDERSQQQNKERALQIIRARVFAVQEEKRRQERTEARRSQIGTGERSEKIRTYNWPQDRITDHRIKESWHNIDKMIDGGLGQIIDKIKLAEQELS